MGEVQAEWEVVCTDRRGDEYVQGRYGTVEEATARFDAVEVGSGSAYERCRIDLIINATVRVKAAT
jgi:hypothetical protein